MRRTLSYVRYWHELLFALNVALVAIALMVIWSHSQLMALFLRLKSMVNAALRLHPHHEAGGDVAFLVFVLMFAGCIFLMLRAISTVSFSSGLLRLAPIVVALSAPFAIWMMPIWQYGGQASEVAIVAVLALIYSRRPSLIPSWLAIAALASHFAYWAWVLPEDVFNPIVLVAVPVAGLSSSVLWVLYISQQLERRPEPDVGHA